MSNVFIGSVYFLRSQGPKQKRKTNGKSTFAAASGYGGVMPSQLFSETDEIATVPAGVNVEPRLGRRGRRIVRAFARKVVGVEDYRELLALREKFSRKASASGRDAQALRVA